MNKKPVYVTKKREGAKPGEKSMTLDKTKKALHEAATRGAQTKKINGVTVTHTQYNGMRKHVYHRIENTTKDIDTVRKEFHAKYPKHKVLFDHLVDTYDSGEHPFDK